MRKPRRTASHLRVVSGSAGAHGPSDSGLPPTSHRPKKNPRDVSASDKQQRSARSLGLILGFGTVLIGVVTAGYWLSRRAPRGGYANAPLTRIMPHPGVALAFDVFAPSPSAQGSRVLEPAGDAVHEGDALSFALYNRTDHGAYFALFAAQKGRPLQWFYPASAAEPLAALPLAPVDEARLPETVSLTASRGKTDIVGVFAQSPVGAGALQEAYARGGAKALADGLGVTVQTLSIDVGK